MKARIELIFDADCPNVPAARQSVQDACQLARIDAQWQEWDRSSPDSPAYATQFGSPTVLVDGRDVAGSDTESDAQACRVYRAASGQMTGAPPPEMISRRLLDQRLRSARTWFGGIAAIGAGLASLLPVLTCPACWPAYAGILGALGVSFVDYTPFLLPAVTALLCLTVASLGIGARARHGFGPLILGLIASGSLLTGRFAASWEPLMYGGVVLLLGASVWNAWPAPGKAADCKPCAV